MKLQIIYTDKNDNTYNIIEDISTCPICGCVPLVSKTQNQDSSYTYSLRCPDCGIIAHNKDVHFIELWNKAHVSDL